MIVAPVLDSTWPSSLHKSTARHTGIARSQGGKGAAGLCRAVHLPTVWQWIMLAYATDALEEDLQAVRQLRVLIVPAHSANEAYWLRGCLRALAGCAGATVQSGLLK